jgi:hypothetical protein
VHYTKKQKQPTKSMNMELKKDLLKKERKSVFRVILGILFFAISIFWITDRIMDNLIIRPFDWFYTGIFTLNGLVHTIEGFGFSIARLFGKAFVLIDNEQISIKLGIIDKEQNIYWKDIKVIDYKLNKFHIENIDNTSKTLDLSKLDYTLKNKVKEIISGIAKDKNIQTSINDY